jgi:hypothetical protein
MRTAVTDDADGLGVPVVGMEAAGFHELFHGLGQGFVGILPLGDPRAGNDGVTVANGHGQSAGLVEGLGVLPREGGQLSDGGILFKYDLPLAVGINFQWIALSDAENPADLLGDHDTAEVINSSDNSGSLHIYKISLIYRFVMLVSANGGDLYC